MARRRPRVVVDVTPLLYRSTGIGRYVREIVRRLPAADGALEYVLFGRRLGGGAFRSPSPASRAVRLRLPRRAEGFIARLGLVEALGRGDLYHATDFYLPLRDPGRAMATVHDLIFLREPEATVDHARLAALAPPFLRGCRRIVAVSSHTKRDLVETLGIRAERVAVIPLGVDAAVFRPLEVGRGTRDAGLARLGLARPYFFTVSCSLGRKNTPALLEAYARLLPHGPENDLVLAWDPPEAVRREWEARGGGRVRFVGRPDDGTLRLLYACATAVVYPSRYEGFGLPVLEAMSCGAPVVCSSTTSLPEVGGDAALYIDPDSVGTIARALESFENGTADAEGMRRRGLERSRAFSWEAAAAATAAQYREALAP